MRRFEEISEKFISKEECAMSTSVDVVVCPYCKQHTLMRELNCDSLEDNWFCTSCGFVREFKFLKDEKDELVEFDQC